MTGYRVFLRGEPRREHVLAALEFHHPFLACDGPVGPVDLVVVRDGVLLELQEDHDEVDPPEHDLVRYPLLVRFTPADEQVRPAWLAAHAFLWTITRCGQVDEALLLGPDAAPLRYKSGRIVPAQKNARSRTED